MKSYFKYTDSHPLQKQLMSQIFISTDFSGNIIKDYIQKK